MERGPAGQLCWVAYVFLSLRVCVCLFLRLSPPCPLFCCVQAVASLAPLLVSIVYIYSQPSSFFSVLSLHSLPLFLSSVCTSVLCAVSHLPLWPIPVVPHFMNFRTPFTYYSKWIAHILTALLDHAWHSFYLAC